MTRHFDDVKEDEELLGELAMEFRGTQSKSERDEIADKYSRTVERLISTGDWDEMPGYEDRLPRDRMPDAFYEYWRRKA